MEEKKKFNVDRRSLLKLGAGSFLMGSGMLWSKQTMLAQGSASQLNFGAIVETLASKLKASNVAGQVKEKSFDVMVCEQQYGDANVQLFWHEKFPTSNSKDLESGIVVEKIVADKDMPFWIGSVPAGQYYLWIGYIRPFDQNVCTLALLDSGLTIKAIYYDLFNSGAKTMAGVSLNPPLKPMSVEVPTNGFLSDSRFEALLAGNCFGTCGTYGSVGGCFGTTGTYGCDDLR